MSAFSFNHVVVVVFFYVTCVFNNAVVFWIDPLYIEEERSSAKLVIHRNGYMGYGDNTVGKCLKKMKSLKYFRKVNLMKTWIQNNKAEFE